ncbi:MAG: PH domain-containing protein [Candidatus Thorarchaeota archaeon]
MVVANGLQGVLESPKETSFGKTFKPLGALRNKWWFMAISFATVTWALVVCSLWGTAWLIGYFDSWTAYERLWILQWLPTISLWTWIFHLIWLLPALAGIVVYVRSIEYAVISETGKASPEIYVKKGILNITRKHVPFRTVTNIASRAGVFDRLFKIGTVEIQTAGYSGGPTGQGGPEEKLEGIKFYQELAQFILRELRRFRDPYVTGTEVVTPRDEPVQRSDSTLDDEILVALQDIREILKTKL